MITHRHWTLADISEWSGINYRTIVEWVRKQLIPTYKQPRDPLLYIHPDDAEDVVAMCRITIHGLDGWGRLRDVRERYGVSASTVTRWVRDGKILMIRTYGHPLYSVDWVLGHTGGRSREKALAQARRWDGFRQKHPRVWIRDGEAA